MADAAAHSAAPTAFRALIDSSMGSALSRLSSAPAASSSASSSGDSMTSYIAYTCLYALGSLYLAPSVISWTRMSRNVHTEDKTAVRLFALLGFGSLLRAVAFLLVAAWMLFVIRSNGSTNSAQHLHMTYVQLVAAWQALGMVASLVLVSVFLLIFNTWASMIEQVDSTRYRPSSGGSSTARQPDTPPRILFIRMVLATNVFEIFTFFLVSLVPTSEFGRSLHLFAAILLTACFSVCIFLLPAYGGRMCELLGKVAEGADRRQRNIRRIAAISAVFCVMRTLSQLLLAVSEYSRQFADDDDDAAAATPPSAALPSGPFRIPLKRIMEANPIFFFSPEEPSSSVDATPALRWVVLLEVVEFPVEWALLMTLLCVLPSRAVLPSIRGYQSIPDFKWRY